MFQISERLVRRRHEHHASVDQFQLETGREIGAGSIGVRPGNILVPVRDYNTLAHLDWVLDQHDADAHDVVVLTVRVLGQGAHGTPGLADDQIFSDYEQRLFTRVVSVAERHGRTVTLLVAPGTNIFDALAQSAVQLQSRLIVVGESEVMTAEQQAHRLGEAWDRTPHDPDISASVAVLCKNREVKRFALGAHMPNLTANDIERVHRLWVEIVKAGGQEIHHRDVIAAALDTFERELHGDGREDVLTQVRRKAVSA
jgi:hypothetical protein